MSSSSIVSIDEIPADNTNKKYLSENLLVFEMNFYHSEKQANDTQNVYKKTCLQTIFTGKTYLVIHRNNLVRNQMRR